MSLDLVDLADGLAGDAFLAPMDLLLPYLVDF
jgi:hypothetical protein